MEQEHFEALYPDTARFSDIEKLASFIKSGTSAQLISIPGAGRSTVLGLLANNPKVRIKHFGKNSNIHFVLVNFAEVRKRPLFDTMKFLFLSMSDSLRARKMEEYGKINSLFRESLGFKDELVLFQAFKEAIDYLTLEKKQQIVFLFDRFEEYVPDVTSAFFTNLRTLRTRAKYQFSVVFSLNRSLETLLEPILLSDFYEFIAGHYVYLNLQDSVTTEFRVSYLERITKRKISPVLLSEIVKETGGVGRLIKLSVEILLSEKQKPDAKNLSSYLISQKLIQSALSEICSSLLPSEQSCLIRNKFEDKSIEDYLETVGLLKNRKIEIPLFDKHIKAHASAGWGDTKKIVYDESSNTIKSGDVILSDQLTSSEFRLLRFLLQNTERIIERNEIISATWSDLKSTAGITDQAVDQLIFRLRRKIEENTNNPKHLLTVKGRGFRFIA